MASRQIINFAKSALLKRLAIAELAVGTNSAPIVAEEMCSGFNMGNNNSPENNFAGKFGNNFNTGYGKTNMGRINSGQNNPQYNSSFGSNYKSGRETNFGQGSNFGNF